VEKFVFGNESILMKTLIDDVILGIGATWECNQLVRRRIMDEAIGIDGLGAAHLLLPEIV